MEPIRVLLADDHPVVREGLRLLLATDPSVQVVGEAADGLEAVAQVEQCQPQVVLMDLRLPRMDGIEATRRIRSIAPSVRVIILTMFESEEYLEAAMQAGASGYLVKDAPLDLIVHAIQAVCSGGLLINPSILQGTLSHRDPTGDTPIQPSSLPADSLTPREVEVLRLLVEGRTNREIAQALYIAEATAKRVVQSIMTKLEATDRTQAAVRAIRAHLLD